MNQHLQIIRDFHEALSLEQAEHGSIQKLHDMDIILFQALLMDAAGETFKAMKKGELSEILGGLTNLAFYSLGAVALQGADVIERPVSWRHDGYVISIMRLLSEKINGCADGEAENYSEIYCLSRHLAKHFLNADFDKAIQKVYENRLAVLKAGHQAGIGGYESAKPLVTPDMSDCLYE